MKRTSIITPVCSLVSLFLLFWAFTACQKEYSIQTGASLAAKGSLYDSTGNCMSDSVVGTFYDGIAPNGTLATSADTAYVLVKVNVTTAGSYNITSNIQNGIYFSDSGYFTSTGIDTIKLYPVGTPIIPGTYTYNISFDSSTCFFSVITKDSTGTGLGSGGGGTNPNQSDTAWKFTSPAGTFNGIIASATQGDTTAGGVTQRYIFLAGNNTGDSVFYAGVLFNADVIATGNYSTATSGFIRFTDVAGNTIYAADPTTAGVAVIITITSYNAATKVVTGTFSGTAQNAGGNPVNITKGSFTAQTN